MMDKLTNRNIKAADMRAFCRGEFAVNCQTKDDADMFLNICAEHLNAESPKNREWDYINYGKGTCFFVKELKSPIHIWSSHVAECFGLGKAIREFNYLYESEVKEIPIPRKSRKADLSDYTTEELVAEIYNRASGGEFKL